MNKKNIVVILVGVRGAGKTSVLKKFQDEEDVAILTPSTTRSKRPVESNEYYFVDEWEKGKYAWEISINNNMYGMSMTELEKASESLFSMTVFDPGSYSELEQFRKEYNKNHILTVGLDTVSCTKVQSERVKNDPSRVQSESELESHRNIVKNCDVLLRGNLSCVVDAIRSIFECLSSRGGIIQHSLIQKFTSADILLENTTDNISAASYDLRLGDDVWCQGLFSTLSPKNPVLKIPAYSYAIVSAAELANLPSFISARFDLKNSLFFQGVILSNGPQIDPGYRGALFCMLYNGSDQPIGIACGDHFATIEFITTSGVDLGYRDKYQGKTKLKDFMPSTAAVSEGGKIFEKTKERIDKIENEWKNFRMVFFTLVSICLAILVAPSFLMYSNITKSWGSIQDEYRDKYIELSKLETELRRLDEDIKSSVDSNDIASKIDAIMIRLDSMQDESNSYGRATDAGRNLEDEDNYYIEK